MRLDYLGTLYVGLYRLGLRWTCKDRSISTIIYVHLSSIIHYD